MVSLRVQVSRGGRESADLYRILTRDEWYGRLVELLGQSDADHFVKAGVPWRLSASPGNCARAIAAVAGYRRVAANPGGIARLEHEVSAAYVQNFLRQSTADGIASVGTSETGAVIAEIHAYSPGPYCFSHVLSELTVVVDPSARGNGFGRSIFDEFLIKSFELADNIVFFCPLNKVFKGVKLDKKITEYGGIKEVVHMGSGGKHGFPFGFSVGCIYYKRDYKGDLKLTRAYE